MEEVLNGYVTNPTPPLTPNPNHNPNSNRINKKIQKETTLENRYAGWKIVLIFSIIISEDFIGM
jgi:hypothetical protein